MNSSFGRTPFLNRTNSEDHTLSALAEYAHSEKVERNPFREAPRRGFTPSSINKKQQRPQHFVPMNDQAEKVEQRKRLSPVKKENFDSSVKSKRASQLYNPSDLQSPVQRTLQAYGVSSRTLMFPKSASKKDIFSSSSILPEPPLCSPRSVTDIVLMDDVAVNAAGAEWMNDQHLYNTPVFQKRLGRPAIVIQSHVRRMLAHNAYQMHRRNEAAVQIQRMARGATNRKSWLDFYAKFQAARVIQKVSRGGLMRDALRARLAAIHIQRMARGFADRLKAKVLRLENLLATVQSEHAKELTMIQQNKKKQIEEVIPSTLKKSQQKKDQKAQLAQEMVTELRKNNRRLREQNARLEVQCEEIGKRNRRAEAATKKCFGHMDELKVTVAKLEADQKKIMMANLHFEKKVDEMTKVIRQYDEMIEFERKVGSIYMNTIKDQIQQIHSVCTDKELVSSIHGNTIASIEKAQKQSKKAGA